MRHRRGEHEALQGGGGGWYRLMKRDSLTGLDPHVIVQSGYYLEGNIVSFAQVKTNHCLVVLSPPIRDIWST